MRSIIFSFDSEGVGGNEVHTPDRPRTPKSPRSTQTRRRNDLPDTNTITTRNATDRELLAPIFDADPNRATHYLPPRLKGRILR